MPFLFLFISLPQLCEFMMEYDETEEENGEIIDDSRIEYLKADIANFFISPLVTKRYVVQKGISTHKTYT